MQLTQEQMAKWKERLDGLSSDDKRELRNSLAAGMYFRRDRQWKVFVWASGILAAFFIGILIRGPGIIAENPSFLIAIASSAFFVALVGHLRLTYDREQVGLRAELLAEIDRDTTVWIGDIEAEYFPKRWYVHNRVVLWAMFGMVVFVLVTSLL